MNFLAPGKNWLAGSKRMLLACGMAAFLCGCDRDKIETYRVAKETGPSEQAVPAGWQPQPLSQMRVASFRVTGQEGQTADISVVPLPGEAGTDLSNVNRWRGQMGQPAVSESDLAGSVEHIQAGDSPADLYDIEGEIPQVGKSRMLAVICRRQGETWFFKMTGNDELVSQQKGAFIRYLKGFDFHQNARTGVADVNDLPPRMPAGEMPVASGPAASNESRPAWDVPADWKEVEASPPLLAKFSIGGEASAQAFVNVSVAIGAGGGLAANINRWRNQLGLAPWNEEELKKQGTALDLPQGKGMLVDMTGMDGRTGQKTRLLGVVCPQSARTWFYKLMGDEKVVADQKDAFLKFIQSAKSS